MITAVIAYGSAHGDDQAGWEVVRLLSNIKSLDSKIKCIQSDGNGLDWMQQLQGFSNVIFVDAIKSGAEPGSVVNISGEIFKKSSVSQYFSQSHRYPLHLSIELASNLKLLSVPYEAYGIEIENLTPFSEMSDSVKKGAFDFVEHLTRRFAD